ncbi:hypothetical protein BaRGS_00023022 [Batillaria attramentaria]|uniref:Kinesin motor domain-containing protein n=1 Tax=Batillaria attramentaria TaxID=370345 RepID=A0ABD0KFB8_9CAEN
MADIAENSSSNVKVVVRVRPPNELEGSGQHRSVVEIMNENVLVFDPKEEASPSFGRRGRRHRDIRKRRQKDMKFAFDYVFSATSSNEEVYQGTTRCVLDGLLSGYNCSVFAYGATGAGKTHTMLGSETQPGVIYHTMIQLYRRISDMSQEKTCDVAVSYLEVYNEQIRDLLLPRGTLPIREDHNAGVLVPGLSLHKPSNAEELLHMLQFGNKNRTQHPTDANAESSRSHAVFQVFVRQRDRTANISAEVKVAKMCLVDLAGSERATVTKNRGARFREGANINRSLLALGNVINSLADQKYKGHIPYRDSKLTRLLKDSLGGNCRTIMIAAVSPSSLSYEDTYNTLKYADRAKNIRVNIKKNVLSVDFHVSRYGKIVEDLRKEIAELKHKLQDCEKPTVSQSLALVVPGDIQSLQERLRAVYAERRTVRDQQLRQETSLRDTQWRLHRKQKCLQRTTQLTFTQPEGTVHGLQQKLLGQEVQRQTLSSRLQENTQLLSQLQTQALTSDTKSSAISQLLELGVQKLGLEVELNDSRHYIRHLRRLARAQEREAMVSERLITALLRLVQKQQTELQRRGPVPSDITETYQNVCDLVGECGVSWADDEGGSEGEQAPFHINSVIDIPLVSHSGLTGDRVPCLALPAPNPATSSALLSMGTGSFPKTWHTQTSATRSSSLLPVVFKPLSRRKFSRTDTLQSLIASISITLNQLLTYTPRIQTQKLRKTNTLRYFRTVVCCTTRSTGTGFALKSREARENRREVGMLNPVIVHRILKYFRFQWSTGSYHQLPRPRHEWTSGYSSQPPPSSNPQPVLSTQAPANFAASVLRGPVSAESAGTGYRSGINGAAGDDFTLSRTVPSPASTVYAGHTPAPKKSAHDLCVSHTVPVSDSPTKTSTEGGSRSHGLNETFSLEEESAAAERHDSRNVDVNSTLVLNAPTLLNVPVIDSSHPPAQSMMRRQTNTSAEFSRSNSFANSTLCTGNSTQYATVTNIESTSAVPATTSQVSTCRNIPAGTSERVVTPCANFGHGASKSDTHAVTASVNSGTITKMLPNGERRLACDTVTKAPVGEAEDKENGSSQRSKSHVARSINFDGVMSSPMRVEGISYADAVKTPSPARQPLQALDCNSPQLFSNNLPAAPCQMPKGALTSGRQSLYLAGPQALDNIRKLKQFGMPSLVENLVTTSRSGPTGSRPSYMQPTKAAAQRVRLPQKSARDDSFHPKRVARNLYVVSQQKQICINTVKNGMEDLTFVYRQQVFYCLPVFLRSFYK